MEKIHSAILKARQEREARQTGAPVTSLAAAPFADPSAEAADEAWAALDQFEPDPRVLARNRIVGFQHGPESACYDVLRTNVLRQMRAKGWRRLAITSPTPGCGKTTTCLNLGLSIRRLRDVRTLVLELDLRRPSMRRSLGLQAKHSLASVLSGAGEARDNLAALGPNLAFGTNHGPVHNPAELLSSPAIEPNLALLEQHYAADFVLFDMTPLMVSDDAIAFLDKVDCVLIVAAAGLTTAAQIDRCERELAAQTNVLGVVLNKCRFIEPDEDYRYDYY